MSPTGPLTKWKSETGFKRDCDNKDINEFFPVPELGENLRPGLNGIVTNWRIIKVSENIKSENLRPGLNGIVTIKFHPGKE